MKTIEIAEQDFIQMKEELDSLKKLVSENMKLNDSYIRRSMQKKVKEMTHFLTRITVLGLLLLIIFPILFFYYYHASLAFIIVSELMITFFLLANVFMYSPVYYLNLTHESMVEATRRISRFKRQYTYWPCIGFPVVGLWSAWFMYEIYTGSGYDNGQFIGLCFGILFGAVIGGISGWRNNQKIVRKANEVLEEIETLRS